MADEIPFPPPGFTAVLVFDDPTPNTVILKRIIKVPMTVAAKCTDLKGEEMNDSIDLTLLMSPSTSTRRRITPRSGASRGSSKRILPHRASTPRNYSRSSMSSSSRSRARSITWSR